MECNIENRWVPGDSFIFLPYSFILIIRLDTSHEPTFIIHSCLSILNFYMPSNLYLFLFAKVEPTSRSSGTNTITTYWNNIQFEHNSLYGYVFLDLVFVLLAFKLWISSNIPKEFLDLNSRLELFVLSKGIVY